jgi:manganese transport protein
MSEENKGLPMAANRDPAAVAREVAELQELSQRPLFSKIGGYMRRSGPGLMQSAMTLGAGSAAASVIAGASFGYKLLWVQPVAMFLGIMMLIALSNVVLTTEERPYKAFGRETTWFLVFLWALGTIMASIIWHFPQYGLAAGAVRDLADLAGVKSFVAEGQTGTYLNFTTVGLVISFIAGGIVLLISIITTWSYGSGSRGIKLYEWFLRGVIALIIIAFGIVVVANFGKINWTEMGKGFIGYYGIPSGENTTTLVLGMLGAAVGINMTFLYPYSLLAKGWGKHHKTLAKWDLGMSMFLPFVLVTSLVILAMTVSGIYNPADETVRSGMKPLHAAAALEGVMGATAGRIIFDLGLIGMACGAISAHMVVCGFTFCEMFGLKQTSWRFRLFALTPAIGIFGVVASLPIWFPIAASAVCFTMLPIAYLIFLIMNNKRSYIGDAVGHGWKRAAFNMILMVALAVAFVGSAIKIKGNVINKLFKPKPAVEATDTTPPAETPVPVAKPAEKK